jgi:hypothetical protein
VPLAPCDCDISGAAGLARLLPRYAPGDGVCPGRLNEFNLTRPELVTESVADELDRRQYSLGISRLVILNPRQLLRRKPLKHRWLVRGFRIVLARVHVQLSSVLS